MLEIPVRTDIYWYSEIVELDGISYRFDFSWNTRDERWHVSIFLVDGTALVMGIPIVVDWPLLNRFANNNLPYGLLIAIDTTGQGIEPGIEDLGDRVKLVYYPVDEIALT